MLCHHLSIDALCASHDYIGLLLGLGFDDLFELVVWGRAERGFLSLTHSN